MLPIMIDVKDRQVLIVGPGTVGSRKEKTFRQAGAIVTLWDQSNCLPIDSDIVAVDQSLAPFDLLIIATANKDYNTWLSAHAKRLKLLCNRADNGSDGDFLTMAQMQRGPLTIAVGTEGQLPGLSKALVNAIDRRVPKDVEDSLLILCNLRKEMVALSSDNRQPIQSRIQLEIDKFVTYVTDNWSPKE